MELARNQLGRAVAIVGAGPVGALAALYFANRGWNVAVYDRRPDPRTTAAVAGRSINLALSHRGIDGLRGADEGLAAAIMRQVVPVHGRMVHDRAGRQSAQAYDALGEHINAVDRGWLNRTLLDAAAARPNVALHFGHRLRTCDFARRTAVFDAGADAPLAVRADLIVGADGAHSAVRGQLMRAVEMDYAQTYIDTRYTELSIPARGGEYALDPHHLHLWPRKTFMLMTLANIGSKTFTGTLFMPAAMYDAIVYPDDVLELFEREFPDVVPLVGRDSLVNQFLAHPKGSLISVKCAPYHLGDRVVIIGDAAHAMVPFYGQGMNCGFEDVRELFRRLDAAPTVADALAAYTAERRRDLYAISDLAMANYVEMRDSVTSRSYLLRKAVEELLYRYAPRLGVRTLYHMVSFTSTPYHLALERTAAQGRAFRVAAATGVGAAGLLATGLLWPDGAEGAAEGAAESAAGADGA
ncbi:uncharacterized protein V1510DRAFT_441654 [Dipodascopsis tothii]|uniref:uncharacterized protein n=1 Tax=Dipodascopsis tothii TaxID=44089 RepID=UPI0034CDDDCC